MPVPRAARNHHREVSGIAVAAAVAARRVWRRMSPRANWQQQWSVLAPPILAGVSTAQRKAASSATPYVFTLLAETGATAAAARTPGATLSAVEGTVNALSLAGVASDGRPLESLLYGAVAHAGQEFNDGASATLALSRGQQWLTQTIETQVFDAARVAGEVEVAARPWLTGYVRMIEPGACSRCIVLAGRFYRWSDGFLRHPGCRCVHIPAAEEGERFGTATTNPNDYFDSLSRAEQDRAFGKPGAEAIRLGADISQVVNARSGMTWAGQTRTAQRLIDGREVTVNLSRRTATTTDLHGHQSLTTTTGTTKRGTFGHLEARRNAAFARNAEELATRITRTGPELRRVRRQRAQRARLMPETILQIADDRADAIRLLKLYGYLGL